MRTLKYLMILLLLSTVSNAQFKPRNFLAGAGVGYNETVSDFGLSKYTESNVYATVQFIYMFDSAFGAGFLGSYGSHKMELSKFDSYYYGLLFRYQFKWKDRFSPFLQLEGVQGLEQSNQELTDNEGNSFNATLETDYFNVRLNPGVNYRLSKLFYLNASYGELGYLSRETQIPSFDNSAVKEKEMYVKFDLTSLKLGLLMRF